MHAKAYAIIALRGLKDQSDEFDRIVTEASIRFKHRLVKATKLIGSDPDKSQILVRLTFVRNLNDEELDEVEIDTDYGVMCDGQRQNTEWLETCAYVPDRFS